MDENTTIEITPEEREQVLEALEESEDVGSICFLRKVFVTSEECDQGMTCNQCYKQVRDRLIAFVKQEPAKKNMRAVELADKLEKGFTSIGYDMEAIGDALWYDGRETSLSKDMRHLVDAIRNLDVTEDGIPWPLDKDGVPIKIGDTVYPDSGNKYEVISILIGKDKTVVACQNGCFPAHFHYPEKELSHDAPRTLEDIKREILIDNFTEKEQYKLLSLINEAYEIGKVAGNEEASEV